MIGVFRNRPLAGSCCKLGCLCSAAHIESCMSRPSVSQAPDHHADDIVYPNAVPFVLVHLACFAAIWTGVTATALWLAVALYVIRLFGIGAGMHHRHVAAAPPQRQIAQPCPRG